MKRVIGPFVIAGLLFATTAFTVFADKNNQNNNGDDAPEVPYALVYPVAALAGYGVYRIAQRRSNHD